METLHIPLSDNLILFVDAQVDSGAYVNPGDYVRELILDGRDRRQARLERHLLAALQTETVEVPKEVLGNGRWVPETPPLLLRT